MVFWFVGLTVAAVGKTASEVVREVRRQFRDNPDIMTFKTKPDYRTCVALVGLLSFIRALLFSFIGAGSAHF